MVTLVDGVSLARIDRVGAYVDSLQLKGRQILMPSPDGRETHGGCAVMIPFANRIRNGVYSWKNHTYSLPRNDGLNSIHGLVRHEKWEYANEEEQNHNSTTLQYRLASTGYPAVLEVVNAYSLGRDFFDIATTIKNTGEISSPLVVGFHPYFNFQGRWQLKHDSEIMMLNYRDRYFPDGSTLQVNFNDDEAIHQRSFDNCFVGGGNLVFSAGNYDLRITRRNMNYFVLYNGQYSRGQSVAIEPMTGAPDAFNNQIGLVTIEPQKTFECGFRIDLMER